MALCLEGKKIEEAEHGIIQFKTEDGWCPTRLYWHIQSCDACAAVNSSNVEFMPERNER